MPDAGSPDGPPDAASPQAAMRLAASAMVTLNDVLGFARSAKAGRSLLGDGQPIPMMSYGLIEYLMGLDTGGWDVLEAGGGDSTLFWLERAGRLWTIEHDTAWLPDTAAHPHFTPVAAPDKDYAAAIAAQPGPFDLIAIDCAANRYECAFPAVAKLRPGGAILLDNSDWYPRTAAILRDADLIQIDFHDFRPQHPVRGTSSLFLTRAFRPLPRGDRLPLAAMGSPERNGSPWDRPIGETGDA